MQIVFLGLSDCHLLNYVAKSMVKSSVELAKSMVKVKLPHWPAQPT